MSKLFMVLVGCTPEERHIEQHDVFFGIAESLKDLVPDILAFWPGGGKLHVDAWREITHVNGFHVQVTEKQAGVPGVSLFFVNLGGYKPDEFEEFHYKMVVAAPNKAEAIRLAKQTAFYRHTGFQGAASHIDDKFGVDVDDILDIRDILPPVTKSRFRLHLTPAEKNLPEDPMQLGYLRLDAI